MVNVKNMKKCMQKYVKNEKDMQSRGKSKPPAGPRVLLQLVFQSAGHSCIDHWIEGYRAASHAVERLLSKYKIKKFDYASKSFFIWKKLFSFGKNFFPWEETFFHGKKFFS